MSNPGTLHQWIEALPERGRYAFTRAEAEAVSGASEEAVKMVLHRLKRRGAILGLRRGFFVVVPREYRAAGCPPASWWIDGLMCHLGQSYYVALLSAAALHGAGHQQPMSFQVITDSPEREIRAGRVRVEFHVSQLVGCAAVQSISTETGAMLVSTPETTAFDLVRFPAAAGHWGHIATVLYELAEVIDPGALLVGAARAARSEVQRLGWLLERVERPDLADALVLTLAGQRLQAVPLSSAREVVGAPMDPRWRVLVNADVELDL